MHALQLDVLAFLHVDQKPEVQPVDLVRALVVEQVLLSAGNPLVSVRGAVLVAAPVPEVVDPGSTPPIFYAEVPLGVRDSLPCFPVLPLLDQLSIQRVHIANPGHVPVRSEEHTSELQSRGHLVCRLLLEKKNN